ncbi:MAG: hypothetical protein HWE16_14060 [Gammaproteobacteria bacterium]|nr:hypothetical protein [Gammaproteobacteria bacterium]
MELSIEKGLEKAIKNKINSGRKVRQYDNQFRERKFDTRRKILAGTVILRAIQTKPKARQWFMEQLNQRLIPDSDRALFSLNEKDTPKSIFENQLKLFNIKNFEELFQVIEFVIHTCTDYVKYPGLNRGMWGSEIHLQTILDYRKPNHAKVMDVLPEIYSDIQQSNMVVEYELECKKNGLNPQMYAIYLLISYLASAHLIKSEDAFEALMKIKKLMALEVYPGWVRPISKTSSSKEEGDKNRQIEMGLS